MTKKTIKEKQKFEEPKKDEFDERAEEFWKDIKSIVSVLNKANRDNTIYEFSSPIITNYLLWRVLNEIKQSELEQIRIIELLKELKLKKMEV